ncbi:MAG TPA: Gfo/Idh/MocA family oxidoreductase, partial [Candidatus Eremiobacteraceae bacterium]|nr:Gfo/Idh/MocA family oxidoreductase [Candidatus Eremiobacteraceae bacterium]
IAADLKNPPVDARGSGNDANQSASSATVSDVRGHKAAIEDFIEAIQKNREPRCNGIEARRSVALVEAIYSACECGGRVEVLARR